MDIEKLKPQVKVLGKMYRLLADDTIAPQDINLASMRPLWAYTERILKMQQSHKLTQKLENELSILANEINIDDWNTLFNDILPLELQCIFQLGYHVGKKKTKITIMRKSKKMTQLQLADLMGVTQKDISRWENGTMPGKDNLVKLANSLECTIDELI